MTVGSDDVLKVFHYDAPDCPIVLIEFKEEHIVDATWLAESPNFIAIATSEGNIHIYNLADTIERPFEIVSVPKQEMDRVKGLASNEAQNRLVAITQMGHLFQFDLSPQLFDNRFSLDRIYSA
jgi:hypothetical protein